MKVAELKSLARERGLRGYSKLRKAELINLLESVPTSKPESMSASKPVPTPRLRLLDQFQLLDQFRLLIPTPRPVPTPTRPVPRPNGYF